jgi:hypothetical protein
MKDIMLDFLGTIIGCTILMLILTTIFNFAKTESEKYVYECVDYKGDTVICENYNIVKGNVWGTLEDGTKIKVVSYKQILKEEVE